VDLVTALTPEIHEQAMARWDERAAEHLEESPAPGPGSVVADRDGARTALPNVYLFTPIRFVFADQGFAGRLLDWAARILSMVIDIVREPPEQRGLKTHRKPWVVERTLAWLTTHRRLALDYEHDPHVSEELIRWAAINLMLRRITRGEPTTR